MWLIEKYGVAEFKEAVTREITSYNRGVTVQDAQPAATEPFQRRELLGVHKQKQEGKSRVGVLVPTGRLSVKECRQIADLADAYSGGEIRLTVEQNIILPNVDDDKVDALLNDFRLTPVSLKEMLSAALGPNSVAWHSLKQSLTLSRLPRNSRN
jgi:ferredoxin-nitrite reductase